MGLCASKKLLWGTRETKVKRFSCSHLACKRYGHDCKTNNLKTENKSDERLKLLRLSTQGHSERQRDRERDRDRETETDRQKKNPERQSVTEEKKI